YSLARWPALSSCTTLFRSPRAAETVGGAGRHERGREDVGCVLRDEPPEHEAAQGVAGDVVALDPQGLLQREQVVDPVCRAAGGRSEEHTSELQSREKLVCR